jgi:hypothetical protein
VFAFFLRNSLLFSLLLSLSLFSNHHRNTKAHHNNKQRREAPFFEDHRREREKESKKFSPFVQKKTQKSHKVTRKSAEKKAAPTPYYHFCTRFHRISSSLFITHTRHKQQHKQE